MVFLLFLPRILFVGGKKKKSEETKLIEAEQLKLRSIYGAAEGRELEEGG